MSDSNSTVKNIRKYTLMAIGAIAIIWGLMSIGKMAEDVGAGEIVVIQDPIDGELHVYTQPGMVNQNFGTVTRYKKSFQYWFDGKDDHSAMIPVKFYDGGHADIPGSIRVDMPLDEASIIKNHIKFGSQEAIEVQLIGQVLKKAVSMSGPLMSSKESYAEKKNNLVYYIEDQASLGIYKTTQKDVKIVDALTGLEKVVTAVEILQDKKALPLRQEESLIQESNIRLTNLSLGDFVYDEVVRKQIAAQQNATMQVQTAIANAKRAEQDALTVEQQGKADAAKAKWEQEVKKAQAVTEAQQELEVQTLAAKTAAQFKLEQTLLGEGEAARKRLTMQANGALEQKLATYEKVQKYWADAFKDYAGNIVPQVQTGGGSSTNGAAQFMELMNVKAARDLALDVKVK